MPGTATIVDELDWGFIRYGSYWYETSGSSSDFYNGHMYLTTNQRDAAANYAIWSAPSSAGTFEVWAFIPRYYATATTAYYTILHAGEQSTCILNQNSYYAVWVSLGTYQFSSGGDNYVMLDDWTGETTGTTYVGFDAVAFVPQATQNRVFLPFIAKPASLYAKTGIHLGNRDRDWNTTSNDTAFDFLGRLRGNARPAAVVVLSHQVYNIDRSDTVRNCTVIGASVKNAAIFNYLRDVAQAGTKVLIRLWPSPGDFQDTFDYSKPHNLYHGVGQTPQNWSYCGSHVVPGGTEYKPMPEFFRSIDDLANEMDAIHVLNASNGFSEYGFIPANEPNAEWYSAWPNQLSDPQIDNQAAWQDMDAYFQSLYDFVRANKPPEIRVLTPTMAQDNFAELRAFDNSISSPGVCDYYRADHQAGYDFMPYTYNSKNDGFAWHNYYRKGKEPWAMGIQDPCGFSDHVAQYFPFWVIDRIQNSGKLSFIAETDLFSPCQRNDSPIKDKDANPTDTGNSLWSFISQDQGAGYVVAWLLSEDPYSTVPICPGDNALLNYQEIRWHEAYRSDGTQRSWFSQWWQP